MIYEICTRKCTQNARFQADFGRFSCLLCNDNRVQMQMNEARRQNRASTLYPGDNRGLVTMNVAKIVILFLSQCINNPVSLHTIQQCDTRSFLHHQSTLTMRPYSPL